MDNVIKSVLGFNFNVEIKDQNDKIIRTGARTTYVSSYKQIKPKACLRDTSFFTHYNEALLSKIRDFRRQND